jgi:hypothetical protein
VKWFLALLVLGALAYVAVSVPPRSAARMTARGLRMGWEWIASVGSRLNGEEHPVRRKAQAATPQRRATREGIVPQPPKETLKPEDRAALEPLLARPSRAGNPP